MAVKLADIKQETRSTSIEVGDDVLHFSFKPGVWTGEFMDKLAGSAGTRGVAKALADSITEWDLIGEDGQPVKIDAATIHRLIPFKMQDRMIDAIRTAGSPSKNLSTSSEGSSWATEEE